MEMRGSQKKNAMKRYGLDGDTIGNTVLKKMGY